MFTASLIKDKIEDIVCAIIQNKMLECPKAIFIVIPRWKIQGSKENTLLSFVDVCTVRTCSGNHCFKIIEMDAARNNEGQC